MWANEVNMKKEFIYPIYINTTKTNKTGWHFGPSVFWYNKSVEHKEMNGSKKFSSIYPNVRLGYVFTTCLAKNLYINPWMNFGHEFMLDELKINNKEFKTEAVSYIVAVHVGYKF